MSKSVVIYARFSSEKQRDESCQDQERNCRSLLDRNGIGHQSAEVINDKGERGDLQDRAGYQRLLGMITRREISVLVVDQQSRLTRGDNPLPLIRDLVFGGGRFLAVEGIDTDRAGWEELVGLKGLTSSSELKTTGHRVRRGLEGRVLDHNGSAGDFPLGYSSEWVDPEYARAYCGRGSKPKKKVVIDPYAAEVVRTIFRLFAEGQSPAAIANHLNTTNTLKYGKGRRCPNYDPAHLRRVLRNPKYIGRWPWGVNKTLRNSQGKLRQVPVGTNVSIPPVQRLDLRIIDQELWDKVVARHEKNAAIWGLKPHQARRGARPHYTESYPKSFLSGMATCAACGGPLRIYHADGIRRLRCKTAVRCGCSVKTGTPLDQAEEAVISIVTQVVGEWPEWLERTYTVAINEINQLARKAPEVLEIKQDALRIAEGELDHLLAFVKRGDDSNSVRQELTRAERVYEQLKAEIEKIQQTAETPPRLPTPDELRNALKDLPVQLKTTPDMVHIVRDLFSSIVAHEVLPGGSRKRGYLRLVLILRPGQFVAQLAGLPCRENLGCLVGGMPEDDVRLQIDLVRKTIAMDVGPKVAEMRDLKKTWKEIGSALSMSPELAFSHLARWRRSLVA